MGSGPKGMVSIFAESLCIYYSTTEAIHMSAACLPIHPTFYHFPSSCLCVRSHVKHKHFKMEFESLNISAELPKWCWHYPVQIMRTKKGKGQGRCMGQPICNPKQWGSLWTWKISLCFPSASLYHKRTRKQCHLPFTLTCRTSAYETVLIPSDYTIMPTNTH